MSSFAAFEDSSLLGGRSESEASSLGGALSSAPPEPLSTTRSLVYKQNAISKPTGLFKEFAT